MGKGQRRGRDASGLERVPEKVPLEGGGTERGTLGLSRTFFGSPAVCCCLACASRNSSCMFTMPLSMSSFRQRPKVQFSSEDFRMRWRAGGDVPGYGLVGGR